MPFNCKFKTMDTLKDKILNLKLQGIKQSEIAKLLNCSTGTVSYHCNPEVKKRTIIKKRIRNQMKRSNNKETHPYLHKELSIEPKQVCWKHAEAVCVSKLIEKGYEIFMPFNGGGEIDLIAYKDSKLYRVQIKSISPKSRGFIDIDLTRNSLNYKKRISSPYTNIDFFLIYDGYNIYKVTDKVNNIVLRYKIPRSNQVHNIRMAKDYIF